MKTITKLIWQSLYFVWIFITSYLWLPIYIILKPKITFNSFVTDPFRYKTFKLVLQKLKYEFNKLDETKQKLTTNDFHKSIDEIIKELAIKYCNEESKCTRTLKKLDENKTTLLGEK